MNFHVCTMDKCVLTPLHSYTIVILFCFVNAIILLDILIEALLIGFPLVIIEL